MSGGRASSRTPLQRLDLALEAGMRWASILCLVGLLVLVAAGVFVRFVPVASMGWADEIVELAFAWMVFLGAAVLWRDRSHFRVELVEHCMAATSAARRALGVALTLISLIFLMVFTYQAAVLTREANDRSPILELPRLLFYVIMPVAGAIMVGYSLRDLGRFLGRRSHEREPDAR